MGAFLSMVERGLSDCFDLSEVLLWSRRMEQLFTSRQQEEEDDPQVPDVDFWVGNPRENHLWGHERVGSLPVGDLVEVIVIATPSTFPFACHLEPCENTCILFRVVGITFIQSFEFRFPFLVLGLLLGLLVNVIHFILLQKELRRFDVQMHEAVLIV